MNVIWPEEQDFEAIIAIHGCYDVVAGHPAIELASQSVCPSRHPGGQPLFISRPSSLSSSWLNLERPTGLGDLVVDCGTHHVQPGDQSCGPEPSPAGTYQRTNHFNQHMVLQAIATLAG